MPPEKSLFEIIEIHNNKLAEILFYSVKQIQQNYENGILTVSEYFNQLQSISTTAMKNMR